jgi:hypothetical protein
MYMPTVNTDFFRPIEVGSGAVLNLRKLFDDLAAEGNDHPIRFCTFGNDDYIRLYKLSKTGSLYAGDFVRIRTRDIPVRAGLVGEPVEFELDEDQGVGERTAFLYDPRLKVLALQRNRMGLSTGGFEWFVDQVGAESIRLAPVLATDGIRRLQDLRKVSTIEVKFAGVRDPDKFTKSGDVAVSTMGGLIKQIGANSASFYLSTGRTGYSLNVAGVKKVARDLMDLALDRDVTKVAVSGMNEDGQRDSLDLMKLRLTVRANNVGDPNSRQVDYIYRHQAVKAAYEASLSQLTEMF